MDKRKRIETLSESADDKILLARAYDRLTGAEQKNIPAATCFLSQREQALVKRLLPELPLHFFGGNIDCERAVCCYVPEYWEPNDWLLGEDGPICALRAAFYDGDILSHRDFLGALMGSGVKRETVGDIYVGNGSSDFLVTREIMPFVRSSFDSAGRTKLHLSEIPLDELQIPQAKKREIRDTVATLRLDSIVSTGFSVSRGKAADFIAAGRASLNGLVCDKPDKAVCQGDGITVRGLGKIELTAVGGMTKKGRLSVIVSRYE